MKQINMYCSFSTKIIATALSSILIAPCVAQAFEAKISGQVSRMVVFPDDAAGDETQHQDIGWSGSRFRFTGSDETSSGYTWGFRYEIQARENPPTANGAQLSDTGDNQDNRYQDIYFGGDFGKIALGKGDGAANDSTEVDYSGTALSSSSNHQDNWGAFEIAPGVPWGSVFTMFDGLSRQNRVRYDTPNFDGFSFAVSANQGNAHEFAVKYKGEFDGHKLGAAVFYAQGPDISSSVDGNEVSGFSASWLLPSGFNFTVASSESDPDSGDESDAVTFKVGYKTGIHAFTVDVGDSENGVGQEGETTGFTYAAFPHPGVELFVTVRELDSSDVPNSESADLVAIGSRIKF